MRSELQVDEFIFTTIEDAKLAVTEKKKIEYLESHMDTSDTQKLLLLYEKVNRDRIFKTPVGMKYLEGLRAQLTDAGVPEESIPLIQLYANYEPRPRQRSDSTVRARRIQEKKDVLKRRLGFSMLLNVLLILAVIAMFVITLKSDNPNMLNYERTLQNQYATWEQELSERENKVRERERELGMEAENDAGTSQEISQETNQETD